VWISRNALTLGLEGVVELLAEALAHLSEDALGVDLAAARQARERLEHAGVG
jgi:hypothetical protein